MLRRIPIADVRVGMFVHAIDGSWFSHGIWRRRFLVDTEADLRALRECGATAIIIDDERGAAAASTTATSPNRTDADPLASAPDAGSRPLPPDPVPEGPASTRAERARATDIIARSSETIRTIFQDARLGKAVESVEVEAVVDEISASVARNALALIGMVRLKTKDKYTYLHSVAVCALMVNLARQMQLPEALVRDLGMAGLVHDIGKMGVPDDILNKPGQLTDEEFAVIQAHPHHGADILRRSGAMPQSALDVCHHHHEKIDGTGYPFGLKGEEISLAARMGAICDVYDALTSNRAYKDAWTPAEAASAMTRWRGQFDPDLLFAFFQSIAVFPAGMLVRLQTNHLAVVLPNGRRATRPRLRLFYDVAGEHLIVPRDIVLGDGEPADLIAAIADPVALRVHDWQGLQSHLTGEFDQLNAIEIERLWSGGRDIASQGETDPGPDRVSAWRPGSYIS